MVAVVVPALAFAFLTARGRARVERLTIPVARLGQGLHGVRVVQISDIHIGPTLDRHFLRRVVEQVNALQPDVIAVTGDLVDGSVRTLRDEVAPLSGLSAPLGVYFVTGNHEYYHGGAAWAAEVARLGLTVLHNEHRVIERAQARLVVAGVTDHEGGQMDPAHACRPDLALDGRTARSAAPAAGAPAAHRLPGQGARGGPAAVRAHARRAAVPLHVLREAAAARHPGAGAPSPACACTPAAAPATGGLRCAWAPPRRSPS